MPDTKITALTALTAADPANDVLPIVDVSDTTMAASGTTKKISINNVLGCSGTATLASATISGDLTVDTSTLKVDSANNRVGIVQATPLYPLDVTGTVNGTAVAARLAYGVGGSVYSAFRFENTSFSGGNSEIRNYVNGATGTGSDLAFFTTQTGGSTLTERYRLDVSGVATWSNVGGVAGTAMTLNSTGLGVGNSSPAAALDLTNMGVTASREIRIENSAVRTFLGVEGSSGRFVGSAANNAYFGCTGAFGLEFATNNNVRMVVDTSGNVGIGVTPSAGGGCLQLKSGITFPATQVASSDANTLDDYEEGTFTPTIIGTTTAGTGTYSTQRGDYIKIGRLVTVQFYLAWTAHTGTGNMNVSGLPFTTQNIGTSFAAAAMGFVDLISMTAGNIMTGYAAPNSTTLLLKQTPTGGGTSADIPIDTSGSIIVSLTYIANA